VHHIGIRYAGTYLLKIQQTSTAEKEKRKRKKKKKKEKEKRKKQPPVIHHLTLFCLSMGSSEHQGFQLHV
jgi:hypothetical protein